MKIDKIEFKYSVGDKVRYTKSKFHNTSWRNPSSNTPVTEREYTIDGYGFDITREGIQIWYLFHAYCDDYFDYHEKVNEELLEPISEPNQNIMTDIHFKDVFGTELEIDDFVYNDVYNKNFEGIGIQSLAFFKSGYIKGFRFSGLLVFTEDCQNTSNSYCPNVIDRCTSFCKNLPDKKIIIKDILSNRYLKHEFFNYKGNFEDLYKSTKNGLEFLGITQELFNEVWKEFEEEKKIVSKPKKKTTKKSTTSKKSKSDDELLEKVSKMSAKEKKKLLKLLQG